MAEAEATIRTGIRAGIRPDIQKNFLLSVLSLLALLAVWYVASASGLIPKLFFPGPGDVFAQAKRHVMDGSLFVNVGVSAKRVMVGFILASLVAVPLGIVLGTSPVAKALFDPIISLLRPLPSLSWIPLSILWFGIDESQKYAIVFMGTFAPTLVYVVESTRQVDAGLIKAARNLGAGPLSVLWLVVLPGALPGILGGLKVSLALAWACVLSAEMVAATDGLGALIWFAKDWNNMALVLVGMASISITVLILDILFRALEQRIVPWRTSLTL